MTPTKSQCRLVPSGKRSTEVIARLIRLKSARGTAPAPYDKLSDKQKDAILDDLFGLSGISDLSCSYEDLDVIEAALNCVDRAGSKSGEDVWKSCGFVLPSFALEKVSSPCNSIVWSAVKETETIKREKARPILAAREVLALKAQRYFNYKSTHTPYDQLSDQQKDERVSSLAKLAARACSYEDLDKYGTGVDCGDKAFDLHDYEMKSCLSSFSSTCETFFSENIRR